MSNDLIPIDQYMITEYNPEDIREIIAENIGGQEMTEFDLDRITIPSGGGLAWAIPTLDGEESSQALEGVIVFWKDARAYWEQSMEESGGGSPPDCSSDDGQVGHGDPGGLCAECSFSKWESDARGRGQACKQVRLMFMIMPDSLLPVVIALPPTSLARARKHFLRLAGRGVHFASVVHRVTLDRTKNDAGFPYSVANFSVAKLLMPEDADRFRKYGKMLEPIFRDVSVDHSDVEG